MEDRVRIRYYMTTRGERPVEKYILGLPRREAAAVEAVLSLLMKHGVGASGVSCRQIDAKLWEIKAGAHRVFYVIVTGPEMVLLHAYRKQAQKAPRKELDLARRRMKEILQ